MRFKGSSGIRRLRKQRLSQERLARGVIVLLAIALVYQLVHAFWQLSSEETEATPKQDRRESIETAPETRRPRLDQVALLHLFGNPFKTTAEAVQPADAPETTLSLSLRGVFASDDPIQGRAIVAETGGPELPYRTGEALPGGAELKEVYADRVILLRQGRLETLKLPEAPLSIIDIADTSGVPKPKR